MGKTGIMIVGAVVALLGVAGLLFGGIPTGTDTTVLDMGIAEATVESERRMSIPPIASAILLVGGLGIVAFGATRPGNG